ncbi:hypothetical protein L6R53_12655 [Myxococcota bacterium]|nr:hypothetical protein [Myxococcota bacterium]
MPLLLALALACVQVRPSPVEGCEDPACLRTRGAGLWDDAPQALEALVAGTADEGLRNQRAEAIFEVAPQASPALCGLLAPGMTRARCERLAADAALWTLDPARPAQAALALGEQALVLAPGPTPRVVVGAPSPPPACDPVVPSSTCRIERAREAAAEQDLARAGGLCAGVGGPRWQGVCALDAVRAACTAQAPEICAPAAELCLSAGVHQAPCLAHVASRLAATAPASEAPAGPAADGWATLGARLRQLRLLLSTADPMLADRVAQRTWAEALMLAYGQAREVAGDPLDHLPAEALPHVRAAAAWRLAVEADPGANLGARVAAVEAALARRAPRRQARPMPAGRTPVVGLWAEDLPGEEGLAAVAWLGDARRALAEDPAVDLRICVLEAAARSSPAQVDLLVEGLGDPQPLVRWTAARLLSEVEPGHVALAHAAEDPDPRVRRRARR